MLVALYARHSTDKQTKSTRDQIERLKAYCVRHGYTVADVFIDEAKSGSHFMSRRGIRRLMTMAIEGCFQRIVTEDLSRISRDQGDVAHFYKRISYLNIAIETISEGVVNELHIGLKGTMNALYLKDLADKTQRGMIASVLAGSVPGGRTYGYDMVRQLDDRGEPIRGLRKINEAEAAVVRQIFAEYADGKTLRDICAGLNGRAIESPKGGLWAPSTLVGTAVRKSGLLRQTLYKGIVTFNRMEFKKHPETGKRLSVLRPENEWINVPLPELAIVDEELFDQVQTMLDERSSLRLQRILTNKVLTDDERAARAAERQQAWRAKQLEPKKTLHHVLSGRLYCSHDGMSITTIYKGDHGPVYGCPRKGCGSRNVRLDALFDMALAAMKQIDAAAVAAQFGSAEVKAERAKHSAAIDELRPRLDEMRAEMANVISALGRQARSEEIRAYFDDQSRQIKRLKLDIAHHEREIARLTRPERVEDVLRGWRFWVKRFEADPFDRETTLKLRPAIKRFTLVSIWDALDEVWRRSIKLDVDLRKLIALTES